MIYTLKSNRNRNQLLIIDLILVVIGIVLFNNLIRKSPNGIRTYLLPIIIIVVLLFLTQKRYLFAVVFDFDSQIVKTTSVISFVRKEYSFAEIEAVKIISSKGAGNTTSGFSNQNFVIRIKRNLQPQIYEVKNIDDLDIVNQIIAKSKSTFLNIDE